MVETVLSWIALVLFVSSPFLVVCYLLSDESGGLIDEAGNAIANLVGAVLAILAGGALLAIIYGIIFLFSLMSVTLAFPLVVIIVAAIAILLTATS